MEQELKSDENEIDRGLDKLEQPPGGDFVAGLKSFVAWVNSLVSEK